MTRKNKVILWAAREYGYINNMVHIGFKQYALNEHYPKGIILPKAESTLEIYVYEDFKEQFRTTLKPGQQKCFEIREVK